jgi:RNA polymerase sigma-70 factor, ECF subfamily
MEQNRLVEFLKSTVAQSDERRIEEITVLWTRAYPAVSAFISSMVPKFQDADDILQQVAVAVVQDYGRYDRERSFVAWAIGIARNKILTYRREKMRERSVLDAEAMGCVAGVYESDSAEFDDMRKALHKCIGKAKVRWQRILEMRYSRGLSTIRMAEQLGMTQNAIFITLHRIRLALRDCIMREMSDKGATP